MTQRRPGEKGTRAMTETNLLKRTGKRRSPRVSVIIPAYNHEQYIMETVRSVLDQDEQDFEIIVVDDGSTDKTGEIVKAIEDDRVRVVTQPNNGTASAINRGFSLATGSYVSILNSDDRYRPDRLSTLISALEASPENLFAMSRVSLIDVKGRPIGTGRDFELLTHAYRHYQETGDLLSAILKDNFTCTSSNFLFHRSLPERIGPFNDLRYVNDLDFLLRALTSAGYVYCDRELLEYRIHPANTMREREWESRADFIFEFSWVIASLLDNEDPAARLDITRLFEILHEVYPLHLESILFCLGLFRKLEGGRNSVFESGEIRSQVLGFIEDNLMREQFIRDIQTSSERLSEENKRLFGIIGERDGEIARLRETADELRRARQWLIGRIEEILSSRRYQLASALIEIMKWKNVRYNAKKILRAILGEGGTQRIRVFRATPLRASRLALYTLRERLRSRLRRWITRPVKYTQPRHDGPLVSVITPCYNYGQYLDRLLACLEGQTFRDFEIVLMDDGSTDPETIETLARIEGRRIENLRVLRQDNQGVIAARNNAIEEARGKYIFPLDPDDTIDKTFLEKCVLFLESSPPHCFVYTWTYSTGDTDFIWETRDSDPVECLNENRIGFVMYSREQFHRAGGYNPVMKDGYEDWEFCVNLVRSGFVGRVIPEPLYHYFVKARARNWFAIKKHEFLKEKINSLHGEYIHKHRRKLRKTARKRYTIVNPLENLSHQAPGESFMIDLRGKTFDPAPLFSRILNLADATDRRVIVTLDRRWRPFFDLNDRPNLQVYFPEHYHPEGDGHVTEEYLRERYRPEPLEMEDVEKRITSSPRLPDGKKNILYVAPWLIVGGADTMTIDWFRNVSGERFNTYFVTTHPKENTWIYKLKGYAREIYDLPSLGCADVRDIERFLVDFIGEKGINIVHIMNSDMAYRALPAIKAAHPEVSVVAQFHCFDYLPDGTRVGYPAYVPVKYDRYIDFYNIESENLKKELTTLFPYLDPGKFRIIYCCLDTKGFLPKDSGGNPDIMSRRDDDRLNILFIGRLDRQKQPLLMAQIARALKERGVAIVIHVIGDGSLESQRGKLERYRDQHDLTDEIRLYGDQPLESLPDWYRVGDVLLMTSAWEGIPVVLYQAMFMGLVCVAPDVGGVGELVNDETGFLIRDRNDVEAYVSALMRIAGDKALKERLGTAAHELITGRFDIAVMKKGYEELYGEIGE